MNVDQIIDKRTIAIPGPIGDVTPQARAAQQAAESARDTAQGYRDQAETFAGNTQEFQDAAVSVLMDDKNSTTAKTLTGHLIDARPSLLFAAADSPDFYRSRANVQCTGTDDQDAIQAQIDRFSGTSLDMVFAPGNYHMHHFRGNNAGTRAMLRIWKQDQYKITMRGIGFPMRGSDYNAGFTLTGSSVFHIEDGAFDGLPATERLFGITGLSDTGEPDALFPNNESYPGRSIEIDGIGIDMPDNMHAVTAFDGYAFSSMRFSRLTAANRQSQLSMDTTGAGNNTAFRSVGTGKYPADITFDGCMAFGYHLAFQVGGEHLILRQCAALYCNIGYQLYPFVLHGAHPFTMLQCCAEKCKRTIFFEQNQQTSGDGVSAGTRQSINGSIIEWNEESQTDSNARWAREKGAQESWPGTFRGRITYSIANEAHFMLNDMRIPFWQPKDEIGVHGNNAETFNTAGFRAGFIRYDGAPADELAAKNYYPRSGFDPNMIYRIMNQSLQPSNPRFTAGQFWRATIPFRWDADNEKFYDLTGQELVIPGALQS